MTKETKIIAGILAGAAVGAAIALALSSDKGDDLKEKASDWFFELLSNSKSKLSGLTDTVKDKISSVKVGS